LEARKKDFQTKLTEHTPEARLEAARNLELFRDKDKNHLEKKEKEHKILLASDGRPLQKNEGKWPFKFVGT
jgi:protein TilB